ncbi:MAG: CHASE2 domain-containing protein [Alphaproteobacteria bacterium]|nr:CHASE2 domain-containing protein [Alphaproteobacteria bacterium]
MRAGRPNILVTALPFLIVVLVAATTIADPEGVLARGREAVFDAFQQLRPRQPAEADGRPLVPIRYIDIDEESLRRLGQWPWPRTMLAGLIEKTRLAGARAIVFDMVFPEPDRTSPEVIAGLWPPDAAFTPAREALIRLPRHDEHFADALTTMPSATGFILTNEDRLAEPIIKSSIAQSGEGDARLAAPLFESATVNVDAIEDAASGNGALNIVTGASGVVHRLHLVFTIRDRLAPSLVVEALRLVSEPSAILVKTAAREAFADFVTGPRISAVRIGALPVETDAQGAVYLHFAPSDPARRVSAFDVINGTGNAASLEGALVFVGTSAPGLADLRPTPLGPSMPGVEILAQASEQLLDGTYLRRPDYVAGIEALAALVLGAIVVALALWASALWTLPLALLAIGAIAAGSWTAFADWRMLVNPVAPSLAIAAGFLTAAYIAHARHDSQRRFVREAFGHYLAPSVVSALARDPRRLKLGGETRTVTILFCDIRGFTTIAEEMQDDPQALTRLVNRIMTRLTDVVVAHKGTVDKYIGDCVMAFWNAPLDDPAHAENACRCATKMVEAIHALNEELEREAMKASRPFKPIEITIGINTGPCVIGNFGSEMRFDYTALGDAVNLAARLQAYAENYGSAIAVAEATRKAVSDAFALLKIDYLTVRGRTEPLEVYALLGNPIVGASPMFKALDAFHRNIFAALSERDWDRAGAFIAECRKARGANERLYDLYERRLERLRASPPGAGWKGAWPAAEK